MSTLSTEKQKRIAIYQVLPRLFGNKSHENIPNGTIEENGCGKFQDFSTEKLQQIKSFGFTHIWYTGVIEHATQTDYTKFRIKRDHPEIVKGKAGSPYAIKDYYDVDPDLSISVYHRMAEFESLIQRSKAAGLKVILDFVPNHVAREYKSDVVPTNSHDLGEDEDETLSFAWNNNFYYLPNESLDLSQITSTPSEYHEYPAKATGNNIFNAHPSKNDWYETIKLNYGIDYPHGHNHIVGLQENSLPSTWKKMTDILLFWADKGIDSFRCDMAEMVPVDFWHYAISKVKKTYPHITFIAEIYNPTAYRSYIHWGGFDYLYDKVGLYDCLRNILVNDHSTEQITYCWQSLNDIQNHMLHFLENHDEQRIASDFFCKNPLKAIPALVVSACIDKGPLMIYFGQEQGESGMYEEGYSGKDGRTTIFDYWSAPKMLTNHPHQYLTKLYQKIVSCTNQLSSIREGKMFDLMYANISNQFGFNSHKLFTFMRGTETEIAFIITNFDSVRHECGVIIPQHAFEYFELNSGTYEALEYLSQTPMKIEIHENQPTFIQIEKYSAQIIVFTKK